MDGTEKDVNPMAEAEETGKDTPADAASGDAGAGETASKKTAAQDSPEKTDAAKAETAAKADQAAAVADKAEKPAEEKAKPAEEKAKPTDDKAKETEHAAQLEKLTDKVTKTESRLRDSMAENAAYKAGIRPDRVDKAIRLAETSGIDLSADDAKAKFEAALQAVADDMPEFTAPPAGTGSPGAFGRKKETREDALSRGLRGEKR